MSQKERRISQRFQPKPGSHVVYVEGTGGILNLSLEGVFVLDPEPLPEGTEITFTLRTGVQDIALKGIVRQSVDKRGMGIQFTAVSPESKRRLRIYIAELVSAPGQLGKH